MTSNRVSLRVPFRRRIADQILRFVRFQQDRNESKKMPPELTPAKMQQSSGCDTDLSYRLQQQPGCLVKRLFDLTLALPVVLFALPILCVMVRAGQWLQSPGPLFYRQIRSGRDGAEFRIFKFRTMNLPAQGQTDLEENPDRRIYPIGRFLRRSKLDEIPQFINVLLGSMSVVGPRPHHFEDCNRFEQQVQEYALRRIAKPGITGLAQYKEYRGDFEWNCVQNRVARDLRYIREWSLYLDVQLVFKTVNVVLRRILSGGLRRLGFPVPGQTAAHSGLTVFTPENPSGPDQAWTGPAETVSDSRAA